MTTTTIPATWINTGKQHYTWHSPIGPVVVFKRGAYWYNHAAWSPYDPTVKIAHRGGSNTATDAKRSARHRYGFEIARRVRAHTPTPAFPFVVGQRVENSFGTATVVKADRPGWIEVVWDDGEATGDEFDASEFVPA